MRSKWNETTYIIHNDNLRLPYSFDSDDSLVLGGSTALDGFELSQFAHQQSLFAIGLFKANMLIISFHARHGKFVTASNDHRQSSIYLKLPHLSLDRQHLHCRWIAVRSWVQWSLCGLRRSPHLMTSQTATLQELSACSLPMMSYNRQPNQKWKSFCHLYLLLLSN